MLAELFQAAEDKGMLTFSLDLGMSWKNPVREPRKQTQAEEPVSGFLGHVTGTCPLTGDSVAADSSDNASLNVSFLSLLLSPLSLLV